MLKMSLNGVAIALTVVIVLFAIQNLQSTDVSFLFWTLHTPKVALILGTYALGTFTGAKLLAFLQQAFSRRP